MEFTVKKQATDSFYETFKGWLSEHKFPEISRLILPENVFVCYSDGEPVYSTFFYFTDSKLAWVGFPASNKNIPYKNREKGLEFLMEYIVKYAKRKKMAMIITTSGTEAVIKACNGAGFLLGDENVNHYLRIL